ncbi:MAG: alpha/beta fold hydrolase [Mariprofundaceae bacterium]
MNPMLFMHGWGLSSQAWHGQAAYFSSRYDARFVNLPGHGGAPEANAEAWPDMLLRQMPDEPVIAVGWSLGGMLALHLALAHPERFRALVLVAATPRFTCAADWLHGCPDAMFDDFEAGVAQASNKALSRFFALMLHGDGLSRRRYQEIARQAVDRRHPPSSSALAVGLHWLARLDLRADLPKLNLPCLVMYGDGDRIVPPAAGHFMAGHLPHAREYIFSGCGHAPFLTQAETFNQQLETWCRAIT